MIWDAVTVGIIVCAVVIGGPVAYFLSREYGKIPQTLRRMR